MKKIMPIALAFVLAISLLTACGSKKNDTDSTGKNSTPKTSQNDNSNSEDTLTTANWQKVIKEVYGFNLTVPSGWTFKEGKKQTVNPSYSVQFTLDNGDFATAYPAFAQHIFDLTAALSTGGNFKSTGSPDYDVAEQLSEIPNGYGIMMPIWCFESPKYTIQLDISEDEAQKIVQIYLVAVKSKT